MIYCAKHIPSLNRLDLFATKLWFQLVYPDQGLTFPAWEMAHGALLWGSQQFPPEISRLVDVR